MMLSGTSILRHYFGPDPGPRRRILALTLVNNISYGMYIALVPIFLVQIKQLPIAQVGVVIGLSGAVMLTVSPYAGRLADRRQPRVLIAAARPFFGLSVVAFAVVHGLTEILVLTIIATALITTIRNANNVMVAHAGGDQPAEFRARAQSMAGIGNVLAAGAVAAVLIEPRATTYGIGLATIAILGIISAAAAIRLPDIQREPSRTRADRPQHDWAVIRDRRYLAVTGICGVFYLNCAVEQVGLPLWIVTRTDLARPWRALFMLSDIFIVLGLGILISRRIKSVKAAGRATAVAGILFGIFCAGIAATGWTGGWVAIIIMITLTTTYGAAVTIYLSAENVLCFSLAPAERRGEYLGLIKSAEGICQVAGPLLMSAVVATFLEPGWLALGAVFAVTGLIAIPVTAAAESKEHQHSAVSQKQVSNALIP